ncbi:MAG: TRAP transporter large permease subunit [Alphaproteobacteria bacterium]
MDIMNDLTPFDLEIGIVMIGVILEAARRSISLSLPIMAIVGLIAAFGDTNWLGVGARRHSRYGHGCTPAASTGIFSCWPGTRWSAVLRPDHLRGLGGRTPPCRLAVVAVRSGGPAQVKAVMTSALFGTVSGSAVANVMSVGSITIPTMFRAGYRKFRGQRRGQHSAGGQIMPPVMRRAPSSWPNFSISPTAPSRLPRQFRRSCISPPFTCRWISLPVEQATRRRGRTFRRQAGVPLQEHAGLRSILILAYLLGEGYTDPQQPAQWRQVLLVIFAAFTRITYMVAEGA